MAESKRRKGGGGSRPKGGAPRGSAVERLTPLNLVLNAVAVFVGTPALLVLAYLLFIGQFGGTEQNQHLFLGAVCILVAVFLILLSGLKVWEHVKARRRFEELLGGDRKSAAMQNLDELNRLARALGPGHRRRLEARLDEWGVKR